jgi:hypothetical protein
MYSDILFTALETEERGVVTVIGTQIQILGYYTVHCKKNL